MLGLSNFEWFALFGLGLIFVVVRSAAQTLESIEREVVKLRETQDDIGNRLTRIELSASAIEGATRKPFQSDPRYG